MNERLGLLFSDGSMMVFPEGTPLQTAAKEAAEHDGGVRSPGTRIVRLSVKVLEDLHAE